MKNALAATFAASLLAAPAFGGALIFEPAPEPVVAPPIQPAPPPPMLPVWTGPYVGAQLGWGWVEGDLDDLFDDRDDGLVGGVHAGYDFALGNGLVLGAELAYNQLRAEPADDLFSIEANHLVRLTARAGFGLGNTLIYAKGGGAWLDADIDAAGVTDSARDFGWVAGGGVEHLITNNISAGVEGLFHRFRDFDGSGFDIDATTVQARISYRF